MLVMYEKLLHQYKRSLITYKERVAPHSDVCGSITKLPSAATLMMVFLRVMDYLTLFGISTGENMTIGKDDLICSDQHIPELLKGEIDCFYCRSFGFP